MRSIAFLVAFGAFIAPGYAQDVTAASNAYMRAQAAELEEDYERSASLYELANQLAARPEALRSAARMRFHAGHHQVAATHALHIDQLYDDRESRRIARAILEEVESNLALVRVRCDELCAVAVDGAAIGLARAREHEFYVHPDARDISIQFDTGDVDRTIDVSAGDRELMTASAPERPFTSNADDLRRNARRGRITDDTSEGLSPAFFIASGAVTAALAGVLTWSIIDTYDARDQFEAGPTQEGYDDGVAKERLMYGLIGGTAAVGALTLVLAFMTDWDGEEEEALQIGGTVGADGALLTLRGSL